MRSVGDLLESWPEDSLEYHFPKLVLEEFAVFEEDGEEACDGWRLNIGPAVPTDGENNAEKGQENGLPEVNVKFFIIFIISTCLQIYSKFPVIVLNDLLYNLLRCCYDCT